MPLQALQQLERTIEEKIRLFERKNGIRLDDEVRFIRSWLEKPLSTGAVTPSGRCWRAPWRATSIPRLPGPVVELGPGTGPVTEALIGRGDRSASGWSWSSSTRPSARSCASAFPTRPWCRATPTPAPAAGRPAAAAGRRRWSRACRSSPSRCGCACGCCARRSSCCARARRSCSSPTRWCRRSRKRIAGVRAEASERIWKNVPPARVWVYRKG